jgi:hypothetical protein
MQRSVGSKAQGKAPGFDFSTIFSLFEQSTCKFERNLKLSTHVQGLTKASFKK